MIYWYCEIRIQAKTSTSIIRTMIYSVHTRTYKYVVENLMKVNKKILFCFPFFCFTLGTGICQISVFYLLESDPHPLCGSGSRRPPKSQYADQETLISCRYSVNFLSPCRFHYSVSLYLTVLCFPLYTLSFLWLFFLSDTVSVTLLLLYTASFLFLDVFSATPLSYLSPCLFPVALSIIS